MSFNPVNAKAGSFAITQEALGQQGKPVAVTSAQEFTAQQEDLALNPGFETQANEELKNSIMPGKTTIVGETPTGTFTHYLRPSGNADPLLKTPDYSLAIESCMGSKLQIQTEGIIQAGSTKSLLILDAIPAGLQKGVTIIVKSSTGYEPRPVVRVDDVALEVELAFDLKEVPTDGVGIGLPLVYLLEDDSNKIPTLTCHRYLPGVTQMMSGTRVSSMDLDFTAKELIKATFALEGTSFFYNSLTVGATNKYLDVDVGGTVYAIEIPELVYKNPVNLAEAMEISLNDTIPGSVFTVTYEKNGHYTFTSDTTFSLLWSSGANAANSIGSLLGFDVSSGGSVQQNLVVSGSADPNYDGTYNLVPGVFGTWDFITGAFTVDPTYAVFSRTAAVPVHGPYEFVVYSTVSGSWEACQGQVDPATWTDGLDIQATNDLNVTSNTGTSLSGLNVPDPADANVSYSGGSAGGSDDLTATSFTSDDHIDLEPPVVPAFDSLGPLVGKGNITYLGSKKTDNICLNAQNLTYNIQNTKTDQNSLCAATGVAGSQFTERQNAISVTAYLEAYEADKFAALQNGDTVKFFHAAGNKLGGQWKENEGVSVFTSEATIDNIELSQDSGISIATYTLSAYAPDDSTKSSYLTFF